MDEIVSVKNFFASYHIQLSTEWLQSCIDWCKEETLPPNYTLKDLQFKVYEQWLLLDLREVELASLPAGLSNKKLYTLNGNYALQMMKAIDISRPKHWQLQRIRNCNSKDVDEEHESSKRVLQLTLTDGVQEVEAMEYKTVQTLKLNLTPGIKILLMGPITVRRGRLMLQSHNVKVLGGEVEELIAPNAAENILAKCLNLPLNPKPENIEENLLTANIDMFSEAGDLAQENQNQPTTNIPANPRPLQTNNGQINQKLARLEPSTSHTAKPVVQNSSKPVRNLVGFTSEEEKRIAEEIDMMMEVEREYEQTSKPKTRSKTPDLFEDDMDLNDIDFSKIDVPPTTIKSSQPSTSMATKTINNCKPKNVTDFSKGLDDQMDFFENIDLDNIEKTVQKDTSLSDKEFSRNNVRPSVIESIKSPPLVQNSTLRNDISESLDSEMDTSLSDKEFSRNNVRPSVIESIKSSPLVQNSTLRNDINESLDGEIDFFKDIDIDAHLDKVKAPIQIPKKPVILSIEKLQKNMPHISNGKFKIKAIFKSIVEKLTVVDEQFHLVVEVEDDSGHIAVKFHSDVVSELAECGPATMLSLKKGVEEKNTSVQTRILETLRRLKEKLLLLDGILEVQVSGKGSLPVVVNVFDTP